MKKFLDLNKKDRAKLFQEATARYPKIEDPIVIEKDFWVCWVLERLFSIPELNSNITFKGGTSLSKCYGIIQRFSEDCDLTIDKNFIGITDNNNPKTAISKNEAKKRLNNLKKLVVAKINNIIKPMLRDSFSQNLGDSYYSTWKLITDDFDSQTLLFYYPKTFEENNNYILPIIRLEFGARADRTPIQKLSIRPYLQSAIPEVLDNEITIEVNTLSATRTFWEKITLLHAEHHRNIGKTIPKRLFRHYYDIVMLDQHNITHEALKDTHLLNAVVENKKMYFHSSWANYNTASIGTLKIFPNENFIPALKKDHRDMENMFFGKTPTFEKIMARIKYIEKIINSSN